MKSKKLISLLCASALSVSAFASMVITSSAAGEEVLWSDTFDSYENEVDGYSPNLDPLESKVLVDGTLATNFYSGIDGIQLWTCGAPQDSSFYMIADGKDAGSKALMTTTAKRITSDRAGHIDFVESGSDTAKVYEPAAGKDLVLAFNVKLTQTAESYGHKMGINDSSNIIDFINDLGMELDQWYQVKLVINASTGLSAYVGDDTTPKAILSGVSSLSSIRLGDNPAAEINVEGSACLVYPRWYFDDMVIYNSDNGAASTVPAAQTHGVAEKTPAPEIVVPTLVLPEDAETTVNQNFDSLEAGQKLNMASEVKDYTEATGLVLSMAGRSGSNNECTISVSEYPTDANKAAAFTTSNFATAARGPIMKVAEDAQVDMTALESNYAVMTQAVLLHKNGATESNYYVVMTNNDNSLNGDSTYTQVVFGLTTGETETLTDSSYNYTMYHVDPDVFHTLAIEVMYDNPHTMPVYKPYLDGEALTEEYTGTISNGDYKTLMNVYPSFVTNINKGNSAEFQQTIYIDNVACYTTAQQYEEYFENIAPTPAPTLVPAVSVKIDPVAVGATTVKINNLGDQAAQLIHASYDAEGRLAKVELVEAKAETTITAAAAGDKIAVWNAVSGVGMQPADAVVTVAE